MSTKKQNKYQKEHYMYNTYEAFIDESEENIVARLLVLRDTPRDIRERIERLVRHAEWRVYRDERKHEWQNMRQRKKDLIKEISRFGCYLREDSRLCANFIYGGLYDHNKNRPWTARMVARRMAEMTYVYEWCDAYQADLIAEWKIASAVYHDDMNEDEREEANETSIGYRSFETFERNLANDWSDFPEKWPWLTPEQLKKNAESDTDNSTSEEFDADYDEDDYDEEDAEDDWHDDDEENSYFDFDFHEDGDHFAEDAADEF